MVAVIKVSSSMHRILNYNENKVKEGQAQCLHAGNFPLAHQDMGLGLKLKLLQKRSALNQNAKRNSVHISLNFHPSENHLSQEKLCAIAAVYMQKLGFEDQPYLVYRHTDAAHPHLHIVTTNIRSDTSRIDLHHLALRKSEPARKEIEKMFGLVPADAHARKQAYQLRPIDVPKAIYGRIATKSAIANVLIHVLDKYKFSSLAQLNAVLGLYNVRAERGAENSRTYQNGGLVYRIVDESSTAVGVPIKASDFHFRPTLKHLQTIFSAHARISPKHKTRISSTIDLALETRAITSLNALMTALEKKGITTVLRRSKQGHIYGLTYVDHKTGCVLNGSELGKAYSAKALQQRCNPPVPRIRLPEKPLNFPTHAASESSLNTSGGLTLPSLTNAVFLAEPPPDYLPTALKRRKRKKL